MKAKDLPKAKFGTLAAREVPRKSVMAEMTAKRTVSTDAAED